jgi:hypothetical protein
MAIAAVIPTRGRRAARTAGAITFTATVVEVRALVHGGKCCRDGRMQHAWSLKKAAVGAVRRRTMMQGVGGLDRIEGISVLVGVTGLRQRQRDGQRVALGADRARQVIDGRDGWAVYPLFPQQIPSMRVGRLRPVMHGSTSGELGHHALFLPGHARHGQYLLGPIRRLKQLVELRIHKSALAGRQGSGRRLADYSTAKRHSHQLAFLWSCAAVSACNPRYIE